MNNKELKHSLDYQNYLERISAPPCPKRITEEELQKLKEQKKNNNKRTAEKHADRQDATMDIHNKKENKTMCSNDRDNNSHKNNNNIGSLQKHLSIRHTDGAGI